jgi:hypothetical protein
MIRGLVFTLIVITGEPSGVSNELKCVPEDKGQDWATVYTPDYYGQVRKRALAMDSVIRASGL